MQHIALVAVTYEIDGQLVYTTTVASSEPLLVDMAFYTNGASFADVQVVGAAAADVTPPVISAIQKIPTPETATITWATGEEASTRVEYGIVAVTENAVDGPVGLRQAHEVLVDGLLPETSYVYRVVSEDEFGNETASTQGTFTTLNTDQVTSYSYDGLDNLVQLGSPDTGTTTYEYDEAGNRTAQVA